MAEIKNPYNEPESVEARKNQEDPWVMYLIVRQDLGMSTGKIAAQVGHGVGILYGEYIHYRHRVNVVKGFHPEKSATYEEIAKTELAIKKSKEFESWSNDSFRKIVLRAKNEKQWNKIKTSVEHYMVRDAGLTEIEPGSETVMALWPMLKSARPNVLRKLQTL